ncbi:glycosyl transferase family 1, partial [Escherichia coli]|nr:glycosyl transferase family 1 [Escherichia coli]
KKYLNKVAIIPIGIDDKRMSIDVDRIKKIKNSYPGKLIVFSLGRHVYYKGFDYLIDAAKYLDDNYIIIIGGQGQLTS